MIDRATIFDAADRHATDGRLILRLTGVSLADAPVGAARAVAGVEA
jgi:hypothetical protein